MECACYDGQLEMFELFDPEADYVIQEGSNLPHWYQPGVTYFVTFRTEDSIPLEVSRRWYAERAAWLRHYNVYDDEEAFLKLSKSLRREFHERFSREYLESLDKGYGKCVLSEPELSSIVADSLFFLTRRDISSETSSSCPIMFTLSFACSEIPR